MFSHLSYGDLEKAVRMMYAHIISPTSDPDHLEEVTSEIVKFSDRLKRKYGDAHEYDLYHILITSTPPAKIRGKDLPEREISVFLSYIAHKYHIIGMLSILHPSWKPILDEIHAKGQETTSNSYRY